MNGQNPAEVVSWDLRENGSLFYRDTGETSSGNRGAACGGFLKGFTKMLSVPQSLADFPWR